MHVSKMYIHAFNNDGIQECRNRRYESINNTDNNVIFIIALNLHYDVMFWTYMMRNKHFIKVRVANLTGVICYKLSQLSDYSFAPPLPFIFFNFLSYSLLSIKYVV